MVRNLDSEQLKKLSDKSLLIYFKKVRNTCFAICRYDQEYELTQREKDLFNLRDRIKMELDTRKHVPRHRNPGGANINSQTRDSRLKTFGRKSGRMAR